MIVTKHYFHGSYILKLNNSVRIDCNSEPSLAAVTGPIMPSAADWTAEPVAVVVSAAVTEASVVV